jgi:hypothetical protein
MKNHDNEATLYVCSLGPKDVTRPQKQCLLRIANHWIGRYRMACLPNSDLCADLMMGERQLGRICQALHSKGILDYTPGRGAGNWSQFRFPKLDLLATETRHKGDICYTPNKEREPTLNSNTPHPNPPFHGGNQKFRTLTSRETKLLSERIGQLESGHLTQYGGAQYDSLGNALPRLGFAEALELACAQLMLPIESAWAAAKAAGIGEGRKKEPAKVSA